ncbi:MAG: efflux RND transporter periplasmic adaptor subunit [Arenicellales bacterium]
MRILALFVSSIIISAALPVLVQAQTGSRSVTGDVVANRTVNLSTRIIGRITRVHAEESDLLSAGQVIVEIDDLEYRAKLRSAEASKEKAQAELAHRKRIRSRLDKLAKKKVASEEVVDEAEFAVQVAKANLKTSQAEIDGIHSTLAETRIKVPFDAVVINKYAEIGAVTQPGEPLYQIQDQSRLKFRARVKEEDLAHISVNESAQVTISALDDKLMTATIIRVIPSGDERHTFIVELELPVKPGLFPGMFGKATFNR